MRLFGKVNHRKILEANSWKDIAGHQREISIILNLMAGAKRHGALLGHTLLYGPPGCGKTTIAKLIARSDRHIFLLSSELDRDGLLSAIEGLRKGYLVLDEIHALDRRAMLLLYPLMAEGKVNGKRFDISVIATTTDRGLLPAPLRERFVLELWIPPYSIDELVSIARTAAKRAGITLDDDAAYALAEYARGTPRKLVQLLSQCADLYGRKITYNDISAFLSTMGYSSGLTPDEQRYLKALLMLQRAGLSTIASTLRESEENIKLLERHLLDNGYIRITGRGRELTPIGRQVAILL